MEIIVSDAEIVEVFEGTNFGRKDYRILLENSVMKKLVGFHCGYTITQIMIKLKLIGKTGIVTKKGKRLAAISLTNKLSNSG